MTEHQPDTVMPPSSPLAPNRYPQRDFFVCDIFDAAPKSDMHSMAYPIFSISTKPDHTLRRYEIGPHYVEIRPGYKGLATVHDRDVLIYCISQIMAAMNDEKHISSRTIRFKAIDLLIATNRPTGGVGYQRLKAAFERLTETRIETNLRTNDIEQIHMFGLIEDIKIIRETREGKMLDVEVTLSEWVFNAIHGKDVLTLSRNYFRLRKPLERRLYELARKHCGTQNNLPPFNLATIHQKCGSSSTLREFRRMIGKIIADDEEHNHFPDYRLSLEDDKVTIRPKAGFLDAIESRARREAANDTLLSYGLAQDPDIRERAKQAAPGWCVDVLERDWQYWMMDKPRPKDPAKAFLGFCRKRGPHR